MTMASNDMNYGKLEEEISREDTWKILALYNLFRRTLLCELYFVLIIIKYIICYTRIIKSIKLFTQLQPLCTDHRVDRVIESSLRSTFMHWIIWAETFVRWWWMITNQFLKIWLLFVNIINVEEILLIFLILHRSRINEVRLQNLYLALYKHSL